MTFHMTEADPPLTAHQQAVHAFEIQRAREETERLWASKVATAKAEAALARNDLLAALDVILDAPRTMRRSKHAEVQVQAIRELVDRERAR